MQQKKQRPTSLFSVCAPTDLQWLEQWEAYLRPLEQSDLLTVQSVRRLQSGADRVQKLRDHLDQADLMVLLLSADFFADDECFALMERALERHRQGSGQLIPLLLRPVAFRETKLAAFTPWPSDGRSVTLWENAEAAFDDCVRELRRVLTTNQMLAEAATTPLMVHVLILAYRGTLVRQWSTQNTQLQQQIWTDYVQRMVEHKDKAMRYSLDLTRSWLRWLARQMRVHNQTVFYLEQIQPDWLPPGDERMYKRLGVQLPGILIGMLTGLILTTFVGTVAALPVLIIFGVLGGFLGGLYSGDTLKRVSPSERQDAHPLQERLPHIVGQVVISALIGLIVALCFAWLLGERFGSGERLREGGIFGAVIGLGCLFLQLLLSSITPRTISSNAGKIRRWKHLLQTVHGQRILCTSTVMGLAGGLGSWLINGQLIGLINGLLYVGLTLGLISVLVSLILDRQAEGVYLIERLRWTWDSLTRSLFLPKHMRGSFVIAAVIGGATGLSLGLVAGLSFGLSIGLSTGLGTGLFYWILLGLFQGISSERIEERLRQVPNQGIQRSLRNCVLMGAISGGVIWLMSILSDGLGFGLYYELTRLQGSRPLAGIMGLDSWLIIGLGTGLRVGLFLGLCGGLLACAMSGGLAAWRHGILRLLLQHTGATPRHYVRFLGEAVNCILLRRVGGGYSFVHGLLMDHFADMATPSTEQLSA